MMSEALQEGIALAIVGGVVLAYAATRIRARWVRRRAAELNIEGADDAAASPCGGCTTSSCNGCPTSLLVERLRQQKSTAQ